MSWNLVRLVVATALVALIVAVMSVLPSSANTGSWSTAPSPNESTGSLYSVSCVSSTDCWAVGNNDISAELAMQWNGTGWSAAVSPAPGPRKFDELNGVYCVSTSDCWAVGQYTPSSEAQTLIEQYNGTSWSAVTSADAGTNTYNTLQSVTCDASSDCWAVGYYLNSGNYQTLTEHYNGTSWSVVSSPNQGTSFNELYGVSCNSSSDCWAVGYYIETNRQTLTEHYDGTSWSIVTSADQSGDDNYLTGVTCTSSSDCWAVGYYLSGTNNQTLAEQYDGTSWSIVTTPNVGTGSNVLDGVSCNSGSDCWAVGPGTLVEHYDGTSWSVGTSENPGGSDATDSLYGVSCVASSDCWAVGTESTDNLAPLTEMYDGTSWVSMTGVGLGNDDQGLSGVSCDSASDCWAVGSYGTPTGNLTLTEHYDGTSWSIVDSPNADTYNELVAVTCLSSTDCWAVGNSSDSGGNTDEQTLIEYYNGTSWSIVNSPDQTAPNYLSGVTCVSATDCWAVGQYGLDPGVSPGMTLVEQWNGTSWSIVSSPNDGTGTNDLDDVSCSGASSCWAVGDYESGTLDQTLAEYYDGTSWSVMTSADEGTKSNSLTGVTCNSSGDCWAVGLYVSGSTEEPLAEYYDGTSWSVTSTPSQGTSTNYLQKVTCTSSSDCEAVGEYYDGSADQTLAEHYDGTSWSIVTSADVSTGNNDLSAVFCVSASDCWAAGSGNVTGFGAQTLIEQYTVAQTSPSTTATTATAATAPGTNASDSATVTGAPSGPAPSGTVTFYVCENATTSPTGCNATTDSPTQVSQVNLSSGSAGTSGTSPTVTVSSGNYPVLAAGDYCFFASYSGDSNYTGSSDTSTGPECFTVATASSTTATTATAATAPGTNASDSATVTGAPSGPAPSGTVTFYVCENATTSPTGCNATTDSPTQVSQVKLAMGSAGTSGTSPTVTVSSGNYPVLAAGDYCFFASYSGDSNYTGSSDTSTGPECFTVVPVATASSTTATTATAATAPGTNASDSATVTGAPSGPAPSGTVTFYVCENATTSPTGCNATTDSPTQVSQVNLSSGSAGTSGTSPTVTVSSGNYPVLAAGDYCFFASYSGDSNYTGSSDTSTGPECFTVATASSTTATTATAATAPGTNASDSATVTGAPSGPAPSGTVTFYVCENATTSPTGCNATTDSPTQVSQVNLSSGSAGTSGTSPTVTVSSGNYPVLAAGDYCFFASYSGDSNYTGSSDTSTGPECFTVATASSTTATTATAATAPGTNASDSATVTGAPSGPAPSGTVTFYVCENATTSPTGCNATTDSPTQVSQVKLAMGSAGTSGTSPTVTVSSGNYPVLAAGDYCFFASYSGDSNYTGSSDTSTGPECFTVVGSPPPPTETITSVGGLATKAGDDTSSLSVSPQHVGDLMVLAVKVYCSTAMVTGVSGGGVTTWTRVDGPYYGYDDADLELWMGKVTATGSSTITVSFSTNVRHVYVGLAAHEFSASSGASTIWSLDQAGSLSNSSSTTVTFPKLTPGGTGELYMGYGAVGKYASAGSTSGFTYAITADDDVVAYDTNVSSTVQPTAKQNPAGYSGAVAVVVKASPGAVAKASSTTATTATAATAPGTNASDSATVTGAPSGPAPSGTVTFYVCENATTSPTGCNATTDSPTQVSQVNLSSGSAGTSGTSPTVTVSSGNYPVLAAGDYCFFASYSGDSNYNGSSDTSTGPECFTVVGSPPPPTETITSVGGLATKAGDDTSSLSVSPQHVGDLMVLAVKVYCSTAMVTGVSGGGVTTWTRVDGPYYGYDDADLELWMGKVTATGSSTITVSFSTNVRHVYVGLAAHEFSASSGASTIWSLDQAGSLSNSSSTTVTFPKLTPGGTGELYMGYGAVGKYASAGSTSGFTYAITADDDVVAYDTNVSSTVQPTAKQNPAGYSGAVAVVVKASP